MAMSMAAAALRTQSRATARLLREGRFLSSKFLVVGAWRREEERNYLEKMEKEKLEKLRQKEEMEGLEQLARKGPSPGEQAKSKSDDRSMSMVELMEIVEKNEYSPMELKYAWSVIQHKLGHHKRIIELELSMEALLRQELAEAKGAALEYQKNKAAIEKERNWEDTKATIREVAKEIIKILIRDPPTTFFKRK